MLLCLDSNYGGSRVPVGPVSGLARLEAEIVRGKWEAYERRQEAITPRKTGREK